MGHFVNAAIARLRGIFRAIAYGYGTGGGDFAYAISSACGAVPGRHRVRWQIVPRLMAKREAHHGSTIEYPFPRSALKTREKCQVNDDDLVRLADNNQPSTGHRFGGYVTDEVLIADQTNAIIALSKTQ